MKSQKMAPTGCFSLEKQDANVTVKPVGMGTPDTLPLPAQGLRPLFPRTRKALLTTIRLHLYCSASPKVTTGKPWLCTRSWRGCVQEAGSPMPSVMCATRAWQCIAAQMGSMLHHHQDSTSLVNPQGTAKSFLEPLAIIAFPKLAFIGDQSAGIATSFFPDLAEMGSSCTEDPPNATAFRKEQASLQSPPERLQHPSHLVLSLGCGAQVFLSLQGLVGGHQQVHHHHHLIPGGLVVRIRHSHCRGLGLIPSQGRDSLQPPQVPAFSWVAALSSSSSLGSAQGSGAPTPSSRGWVSGLD